MMMTGGGRRCSHCGNNGHNSRTCYDRKGCLKLFGVRILADDMENDNHHHHQFHDEIVPIKKERNEAIKRSLSMGHLLYHHHQHLNDHHSKLNQNDDNGGNADNDHEPHHGDDGYLSDGLTQYSYCKPKILLRRRKKGVPWTEEEHKTFLIGLKTLGKGDWRGISKNFVHTRTPTQVASHAQKYFMRQLSAKGMKKKTKRRMSLFDLPLIGDLSINSPTTSPFASPNQESPPRQVENLINSSGDSSDNCNIRASTFHAHHSHALPPLSPQGQVFKALPYTQNCTLNEDFLKLNQLTSVSPKQVDDTRLQLGLPSSASPNTVLASSMLEDMLELRIALPVGLQSK